MTVQLHALCVDAGDPHRLARFWAGLLGWEPVDAPHDGIALLSSDDTGFRIRFPPTGERKSAQNRMHFDLTSTSVEERGAGLAAGEGDQRAEVDRLLAVGATRIGTGRDDVGRVELTDPDGNEFCVMPPRQPVPVG